MPTAARLPRKIRVRGDSWSSNKRGCRIKEARVGIEVGRVIDVVESEVAKAAINPSTHHSEAQRFIQTMVTC